MIRNVFLTLNFTASIIYRFFSLSVTYGIFALWFSLNKIYVIKFSVSFDTDQIELKNHTIACYNRSLRATKNSKESNGTSFSSNGQHTWLEIPFVMMGKLYLCSFKCLTSVAVTACMRLSLLLLFFFFFFFT